MTEDAVSLKSRTEDHFLSCILPQSDRREDHPGIGVIAQLHTAQKNRGWEMKTSDTYRISCLFPTVHRASRPSKSSAFIRAVSFSPLRGALKDTERNLV